MKINPAYLVLLFLLLIILSIISYASLGGLGVDTPVYLEYLDYVINDMDGLQPFWGYPGEYLLPLMAKLFVGISRPLFGDLSNTQVLLGIKIVILGIGLAFICLFSALFRIKRPTIFFLILYLSSDIFVLGFINSLRTGFGLFFLSLLLSLLVAKTTQDLPSLNPRDFKYILSPYLACALIILSLAFLSHLAIATTIVLSIVFLFVNYCFSRAHVKQFCLASPFFQIFLLSIIFLSGLALGRVGSFRSSTQDTASALSLFKLLYDTCLIGVSMFASHQNFFLLSSRARFLSRKIQMPLHLVLVSIASISVFLLGLAFSTFGSETSNRVEQLIRLFAYCNLCFIISPFLAKLCRKSWITLCCSVALFFMITTLTSGAINTNLG